VKKLAGDITAEEAMQECLDDADDAATATSIDPMKQKYICTSCYLHKAKLYEHPVQAFGVHRREDFFSMYVSQGSWARCLQCQSQYGKHSVQNKVDADAHSVPAAATPDHCPTCKEKFPDHTLLPGEHGCTICLSFFLLPSGTSR
jgi:hypothetical protein